MKYSPRNALTGTIKEILPGMVNVEIVIDIAPGLEIVSVITKTSSDRLNLAVGQEVCALVKASNVMLAVE